MKDIVKFGLIFLLSSLVFSLFGTYISPLFDSLSSSITYITTGSIGMVLNEVVTFIGWLLDLIFLNSALGSYTLSTAPSITVGSISWVLSLFRLILGCIVFVLIFSLIFGKGGN